MEKINNDIPLTEKVLTERTESFLKTQGYKVFKEVKLLTRKVDLVGIRKGKLIAIEVKVNQWKKALQQAIACSFFFNETYVAIWHRFIKNLNFSLFNQFGIGVMSVNGTITIIEPSIRREILPEYNDILINFVKREKDEPQ